jgi:predicted nucleic-acid-binding protein
MENLGRNLIEDPEIRKVVIDLIVAEHFLSSRDPLILSLRKLIKAKKAEFQRSLINRKEV